MKKDMNLCTNNTNRSNNNSNNLKIPYDLDFHEWGHEDSIPIFIQKCEILNTNLLKAIAKIDNIFRHKHSTMEDVEYLKSLEIDFKFFYFVPISRIMNKEEFDRIDDLYSGLIFTILKFFFKRRTDVVYYYPDDEVELNDERLLLCKSLIIKYLNDSIISYCNFFENQEIINWDDKYDDFISIIILNVEGYKYLSEFFDKLLHFFILLPLNILEDYTPKTIGFDFRERNVLAENEPNLLKRKEIYAEGMAQLEMSMLGTKDRTYAFIKHEYPQQIKKYRKAIKILEERIKHSTASDVLRIENNKVQSEYISTSTIHDFLNDKNNSILFQEIQNAFKHFEGKRLAILIYLLQLEFNMISISPNSNTHSRKQFILLFKADSQFDKFQAVNKYINPYTNKLNLQTEKGNDSCYIDSDYIDIKQKLTKILENTVF